MSGDFESLKNSEAKFLKTKRGGAMLVDINNHTYTQSGKAKDSKDEKKYWRCTLGKQKNSTCKSYAITKGDIIVHASTHDHFSNLPRLLATKARQEVVDAARAQPTVTTQLLVSQYATKVTEDKAIATAGPKSKTVARLIQKAKQKALNHPHSPQSFHDLAELPPPYTLNNDHQPFLITNQVVNDEGQRILVFMSPFGLKVLSRAKTWTSDGTFRITPVPFSQTYIFLGELHGKAFPGAYVFMPDKKSLTYKAVFSTIKTHLLDHADKINLTTWLVDFETAVVKEIWSTFGGKSQVRVHGCYVHWRRNLRRRIANHGLIPYMNRHAGFQIWMLCLASLAFIPAEEVHGYYAELIDYLATVKEHMASDLEDDDEDKKQTALASLDENMEAFLDGFEGTYIGRKLRSGGYSIPRFEPEMWSQFKEIQENLQLTTNRSENVNSVLSKSIPASASLWTVIDRIKDHESRARLFYNEHLAKKFDESNCANKSEFRKSQDLELKNLLDNRHEFFEKVDLLKSLTKFTRLDSD